MGNVREFIVNVDGVETVVKAVDGSSLKAKDYAHPFIPGVTSRPPLSELKAYLEREKSGSDPVERVRG